MRRVTTRPEAADRHRRRRSAGGARGRDPGPPLRADALEVGPLTGRDTGGKLDPVRRDQMDREGRLAAQQPERRVPASDAHGAWVGLLITMINLLPLGQLDGGHVATAYFGNGYNRFAERLRRLLPSARSWCFSGCCIAARAGGGERVAADSAGMSIAMFAALPWLIWFPLVGLMRRDGRRESPAGRRKASAAEPAGVVLVDGAGVRRCVHAGADAADHW